MDAYKEYIEAMGAEVTEDAILSICKIKPRRVKVAMKVNQRKSKLMNCSTCRLKYFNQASIPTSSNTTSSNDQDSIPSIPCHAIFVFLDPILLGVLQVGYQSKKESPFDTHPLQIQTFLTAICIYSALLGIKFLTKAQILSYALLFFGSLSSASLLSILLKQQLLWIVLIIWGFIPILIARHMLKSCVCWIITMLVKLTRGGCNCMFAIATFCSIFCNEQSSASETTIVQEFEGI